MDLSKHECRSVISAQSNNYAHSTDSKTMQNNNNESVNGDSVAHPTGSTNCDYDDGDNIDTNAGEMSDSCGSDKMNMSEMKISGQVEDKDKVSGKGNFN